MAIMLYDKGAEYINKVFWGTETKPTHFLVMLFTNEVTPYPDQPALVEALGGGYTRLTIDTDNLFSFGGATSGDGTGLATVVWNALPFPFTGNFTGELTTNLNIYGYAILRGDAAACNVTTGAITYSDVIFADRLASPFTPALGNSIQVTPTWQLSKGVPTA
jgi:hypothetical protein